MDQQTDSYRIRLARPNEVPRLQEIEDEAGTIFSGLGLIHQALDVSFPLDDLARLVGMGQVWVGCQEDGLLVGMVIASVREGAAYVEEMDVLPEHGRRGLGARLLACVCAWAKAQGHAAVTLSTFRDVPWNGPFYRKQGPAARGVDTGHAGDPRERIAARPLCRGAGVHASGRDRRRG